MNPDAQPLASGTPRPRPPYRRPFLGIYFRCCDAYGRIYRSEDQTRYEGTCPRCLSSATVRIAPSGSRARFFEAF